MRSNIAIYSAAKGMLPAQYSFGCDKLDLSSPEIALMYTLMLLT